MSKFTAQEAFEAQAEREPIMITHRDVGRLCSEHSAEPAEFYREMTGAGDSSGAVDAATLLQWLGY